MKHGILKNPISYTSMQLTALAIRKKQITIKKNSKMSSKFHVSIINMITTIFTNCKYLIIISSVISM